MRSRTILTSILLALAPTIATATTTSLHSSGTLSKIGGTYTHKRANRSKYLRGKTRHHNRSAVMARLRMLSLMGTREVPRCGGIDDSAVLKEAVSAARGGPVVIANGQICAGADLTIPNLRIEKGGLLRPTTSHSITLSENFEAGPYQTFTNALSGQGTIIFGDTSSVASIYPQWWGAKADERTDNGPVFQAVKAAWDQAALNNHSMEVVFQAGIYPTSVAQNWFGDGITLRAEGRVIIKSTGKVGNVLTFDAGPGRNGYRVRMLGDFVLDGSGNSAIGLYTRNVHHSEFNARVRNVTSAGLKTEGAVLNDYTIAVTAAGDSKFVVSPENGVVIDRSTIVSSTVGCQFHLVIENTTGTGVLLRQAIGNTFWGTAEGLGGWGVQISQDAARNNFERFFCEANKLGDFEVSGSRNFFNNCTGSSIAEKAPIYSIKGIVFKANAKMNSWMGGYFYAGLVEPGADSNQFWAFESNYKVFDSGTNTARWGLELYNSAAILPANLALVSTRSADATAKTLSNPQGAGLPKYANNAAAVAGGLAIGSYYRTGGDPDLVCVVH